jgi:hypothetical protein
MVGSVLEAGARITGKMPAYTRSVVYELIESVKHLDCSATYKTFGYQPRPARESIAACIDWLLEIDAVKPKAVEKIRAHRAI